MTAQLLTSQSSFTRADMGALPAEGRDLVADLRRVVQGEVRFDGYTRMLYSTDASQYQIKPIGVVIPKTAADVQATVELAAKRGVPVLPRGGGSSLAGQAVGAAIVIDFSKYMNQVVNVDADAQTATVQPGINFASLNTQMGKHGLMIGPDPASANRATIGGSIGNNATGSHSILYGMMADNVLETAVILSDGSQARFGPVDADTIAAKARYDNLEGKIYRDIPRVIHNVMEDIVDRFPKHWRRASGYNLDRLAAALLPP
ncbi:MAG: FAD-binding oxidoreductase, partial [Caldilineaceae bacterium]|nr:FAD-binding oxidoreductase [Caldilineaceae bacterium]